MASNTKPKTLDETVEIMSSEDYKDRLRAEYYQVKIRHKKLSEMIAKYAQDKLDFEPNCSLELLQDQLNAMYHYMFVLEIRAKVEKIKL